MVIVIMAGGSGTRFWPMSRSSRPKQLLNILGDQPMIRATYERVKPLTSDDRVVLVVGEQHREETERLFSGLPVHILAEPFGRNTAPCIGLAAQFLEARGITEPMVILPADHYIARPEVFREALCEASSLAARGGIVTIGIVPTRPETGYGYIERDPQVLGAVGSSSYRVLSFVEKPSVEVAERYVLSGNYYWNAGIFVATPQTLLEEYAVHMPDFHRHLQQLNARFNTPQFTEALKSLYNQVDNISFDYAVMEKTRRPVHVIPCDCGWSDVGSWYSLYEVRHAEMDDRGNVVEGEALTLDCERSMVLSRGRRWIAALGLRGILVMDTEDALLVADLEHSQDVKKITDYLKQQGIKELL